LHWLLAARKKKLLLPQLLRLLPLTLPLRLLLPQLLRPLPLTPPLRPQLLRLLLLMLPLRLLPLLLRPLRPTLLPRLLPAHLHPSNFGSQKSRLSSRLFYFRFRLQTAQL
jgi:hypothetical protein